MIKSVYKRNKQRKELHCLKCGRPMWTDVCHRICRRCTKRNYEVVTTLSYAMMHGTEFKENEYELE